MFLFGSRHWFLALFSLANQSSTKDSDFIWGKDKFLKKKSDYRCFKLKPAFGIKAGGHHGQRCMDRHPTSEDQ